jgi:hypothetical protein
MGSEPDVKASVKLKKNDKVVGGEKDKDARDAKDESDKDRESRSRLRFWRREGEAGGEGGDDGQDDGGHDR